MPLFGRKSDEEKKLEHVAQQRRAEEQNLQVASQEALAAGGIPVGAQQRLDALRGQQNSFFTSDLSVNEFLLAREAGCRPISQVMGSSLYHVGWQRMPGQNSYYAASQELTVLSRAYNRARTLALGRLQEEAERLGADAVVGVHVERGRYEWSQDMIEFATVGTAIRVPDRSQGATPTLTNLSGQDFWKLIKSGYSPGGVIGATTVFYVVAGWQTQQARYLWGSGNIELQDFSEGVQIARESAMEQIQRQAGSMAAVGVVGVEIEQDQNEHVVQLGNDTERTDMIFTFHALGTALSSEPETNLVPDITMAMSLGSSV